MIDPGITRPNSKEQTRSSLKILHTIATNLLKEPENEKYKQFKTHNPVIKKNLIEAKGALEYAIELGFRPTVVNFEPMYVWDSRKTEELLVGAAILEEFTQLEKEKAEREKNNKVDIKALNEARAQQAKLAYMDDRAAKKLADEREKERLAARALMAAQKKSQPQAPRTAPRTSMSPDPEGDGPPQYTILPIGQGRTLADTPPATSTPEDEEMH